MSKKAVIQRVPNVSPSTLVKYLNGRDVYLRETSVEAILAAVKEVKA